MVPSRTTPSTRRLSEVARHVVVPEGIVSTGWPAVEAKCAEWGDTFDAWQVGLGRVMLGKRADDLYAATVGGITLSIPRQVAKTFLVGRTIMALCAIFPGMRILWTAHHTATLSNTFRSLSGFARRKKVAPYIEGVYRGSGKESIIFRNGSAIYFGARDQGFGRGFEEIDVEVFDEAQILNEKALEDMVAATNQSRHPHGALLFYMGTPPRAMDPGEVFTLRRKAARDAKPDDVVFAEHGDAVYVECSADPNIGKPGGPSMDDRRQLERANPSYPHRTPESSIKRLRANMPSDDSWRREGLGVWDDDVALRWSVIPEAQWTAAADTNPPTEGGLAYALDMSPDRQVIAISAARRPDYATPRVHVETVKHQSASGGLGWAVDWLAERWAKANAVVIDAQSPAMSLVPELEKRKVKVTITGAADMSKACGMFADGVRDSSLSHFNQPALTDAASLAVKRAIGQAGGWGWDRRDPTVDLTPLVSATLALYGAMTSKRRAGRRSRAVVMS